MLAHWVICVSEPAIALLCSHPPAIPIWCEILGKITCWRHVGSTCGSLVKRCQLSPVWECPASRLDETIVRKRARWTRTDVAALLRVLLITEVHSLGPSHTVRGTIDRRTFPAHFFCIEMIRNRFIDRWSPLIDDPSNPSYGQHVNNGPLSFCSARCFSSCLHCSSLSKALRLSRISSQLFSNSLQIERKQSGVYI